MSEKPRLKDSDEILNSLGRAASNASDTGRRPAGENSMRRRRGRMDTSPEGEGPALDFGKYEIPAGGKDPKPREETPEKREAPIPEWILAQMPSGEEKPEKNAEPDKAITRKRSRGRPPKKRAPQAVLPAGAGTGADDAAASGARSAAGPAPKKAQEGNRTGVPKPAADETLDEASVKEYSFESFDMEPHAAPQKPNPSEIAPPEKKEGDPRGRLLVDGDERDVFMRELSQRFERRFAEKFETPRDTDSTAQKQLPEIPDFWSAPKKDEAKPYIENDAMDSAEGVLAPEAEEFMGRFMNDTLEEEENRSREFKDTLAQKFMRERERYLRELGAAVAGDAEESGEPPAPEPAPEPPRQKNHRRKLDFQIVPEMHLSGGEPLPANPVTYTRDARVRPQEPDPQEENEGEPKAPPAARYSPAKPTSVKKSGEQLLNELAIQAKAAEERLNMNRASAPVMVSSRDKQGARPSSKTEKPARSRGKTLTKQAVILSSTAIMLMLSAVLWTFKDHIFPQRSPIVESSGTMAQVSQQDSGSTLTIYEDRRFTERGDYNDVLVKRPNVSVNNLSVRNLLVISDVETTGEVSLRDVSVDGAIHVKSCAANVLNLTDVKTPRVVINNSDTQVTVRVGGNSDIGEIEMRTAGTIEQADLSGDALGVRGVVTGSEEDGGIMNATLTGMNLASLATYGDTVLKFNDAHVSGMSSEGSISIDGTGRIINLSIGVGRISASGASASPLNLSEAVRPMALTETRSRPLLVVLKGVSVSNLYMRNSGDVNISAQVDSMAVSDNTSITGSGSIGSLTVNRNEGNSRVSIEISGPGIPTLTTEAQTRINISGAGKVNNLICNESTYALGNKVNNMIVNADGCIYENTPDRIMRAEGVHPPESVAENPNLNYNAAGGGFSAPPSGADASAAEAEVGTACGHTRSGGGFINGEGSMSSPFEVSTPAQLAHVASHLNSYFIQVCDIDIADDGLFSGGFPVIASEEVPFSGEYDGKGYSIQNLRIITDKKNVGLFGSNTGTVKNVHILSGEINATLNQGAYVGAIAGFCYNDGQVINCSNRAKVTGKLSYVGGIVGYNYGGRIKDCYNAAKITANSEAGGIVGVNRQSATVAGCYNAGTISAEAPYGAVAGSNDARIINCYYLEDTAELGVGAGEGAAAMRTSEEMQGGDMVDELAAGNLDTLWARGAQGEGYYNYPVLAKPGDSQ